MFCKYDFIKSIVICFFFNMYSIAPLWSLVGKVLFIYYIYIVHIDFSVNMIDCSVYLNENSLSNIPDITLFLKTM